MRRILARRSLVGLVGLGVSFATGVVAGPVGAVVPGQNGRIAYQSNGEIFTMGADGAGKSNVTNLPGSDREPAWSPDGTKIAFTSDRSPGGVFVMGSNGAAVTPFASGGNTPTWSPDGSKIAYMKVVGGNQEIFVGNADGTGTHLNVTANAANDRDPSWSPDGTTIAFVSERVPAGIWTMTANGSNPQNLTAGGQQPMWSPDGTKIAFAQTDDIFVMNANGTGAGSVTDSVATGATEPAWSPDGTKIAFTTQPGGGAAEVFSVGTDGTNPRNLTDNGTIGAVDTQPDWQRAPAAPPTASACGDTIVQLNLATVEGDLAETGPGTGVFRAGPGPPVFVGGFELRPRFGGALLVDTNTNSLAEEGAGVQVFFGRFELPLSVGSIPINTADATFPLNRDGTLLKTLFAIPISGQLRAAWADGGRSAGLELELEAKELIRDFGDFEAVGASAPSLKLAGKQANCTGLDFTGLEIKADELSFKPKTPGARKLGLKNFLFKYEEPDGVSKWTGQGEVILPVGRGELSVGGKLSILGSELAGIGVAVSGINRPVGYGLFLQHVEGEFAFEPTFAANFGVNATLGPVVDDKKLVELSGTLKNLALATECTNGEDPIALVATGTIPLVESLDAGKVKLETVNCIYTNSFAIEQSPKVEAVFGEVVNGQIPNPVVAARASLTGFAGEAGINAEGAGSVTIPVIGEVGGKVLLSTTAFAACGNVRFFDGGAAHRWGESRTEAFSHCDLAPWRAGAGSSAFAGPLSSVFAPEARASVEVDVPGKLPFVGWSAQGKSGPPRLRVTGPRGERFTSPLAGRALVRRNVVIVPVAAERRTFVFVKSPSLGRWRIDGIGGRISGVRTARGLPKPKVRAELVPDGATKQALIYTVAPLPGQSVKFFERTEDGVLHELGRARGREGRIVFTPLSSGQSARVDAIVEQDGFPRDTVTLARFTATPPGAKPPARPGKLKARRAGRAVTISWARAAGAARYRVDVTSGARRVVGRTTQSTRLKLPRVPAGPLRVEVRAISGAGAASAPARLLVRRGKR